MRQAPLDYLALLLAVVLLPGLVTFGCGNGEPVMGGQAGGGERYDMPDAAWQYYQLKRQPDDPAVNPQERYRQAMQQMQAMPLSSARLGRLLPSSAGREHKRLLGTWEPLGPGNIGGRTRVLVIDPDDPGLMYSGGVSGGLWRTGDGGASWRPLGDQLANLAVNSLVMSPVDHDVLYAGTGEGYFREEVRGTWLPLRGAGIFRTTDGGDSWSRLPSTGGADFYWVNDLLISPRDAQRLYAATRTGVWRSADGGDSWQRILATTVKGGCLDLALRSDTPSDMLLASCGTLEQASVLRSLDAALSEPGWETVLSEHGMGRTSLVIAPSDQQVVYALAASNLPGPEDRFEQGLHAVFRSDAGGAAGSWRATVRNTDPDRLGTLLLTNPISASLVECGFGQENDWVTMGWYVNVIAVDPIDPDVVWAGGVDLFRSDDGGERWGLASYWWMDLGHPQRVHADQHAIVFHPDYDGSSNRTIFVTNDGGIAVSLDAGGAVAYGEEALCAASSGMSWIDLNHGYGVTQFYHGAPFPDATSYLGGTQDNGTIVGTDLRGHDGWIEVVGGDGGYVAVDPSSNIVYAETWGGQIRRSMNGGLSFQRVVVGLDPAEEFLFIAPFVLDGNDSRNLWTGSRRLFRTTSRASLWQQASADLDGWVSAVAVAPGDSNRVVAGTSEGWIYRSDQALTTDQGSVWTASRPRGGFVSWLAFDPVDPHILYATYAGFGGSHVWRSSDAAATWTAIDGSGIAAVPDIPVHCLVVDPQSPRRLFLGTDLGVLSSNDRGATWAVESTGFANVVTESLAIIRDEAGDTWLFAFTHGRGAWRTRVAPLAPTPRRPGGRARPA